VDVQVRHVGSAHHGDRRNGSIGRSLALPVTHTS
jgi:hypothetical protein